MISLDKGNFNYDETNANYKKVCKMPSFDSKILEYILDGDLIELENTNNLTLDNLALLPDNIRVRITGGFTFEYMSGLKNPNETNLYEKCIYTKEELIQIISVINEIESNLNVSDSQYQIALKIYEYLKKNILYRVPKEYEGIKNGFGIKNRDRCFDTLIGLIKKVSTCNGFAFIYQELLNRQGIKTYLIGGKYLLNGEGQHAFNVIEIDNDLFLVDIIWDAINYENGIDTTTGFGLLNKENYVFKNDVDLYDKLTNLSSDFVNQTLNEISFTNKIAR